MANQKYYWIVLRGQAKYVFYKLKIMALLENSILMRCHSIPLEYRRN